MRRLLGDQKNNKLVFKSSSHRLIKIIKITKQLVLLELTKEYTGYVVGK